MLLVEVVCLRMMIGVLLVHHTKDDDDDMIGLPTNVDLEFS